MKLNDYLEQQGITMTGFARKIGVHPKTIGFIIDGYDTKLSVALKIEKATKGAVKCKDLAPTKKRRSGKEAENLSEVSSSEALDDCT